MVAASLIRYCLRRGRASVCVQEAVTGSNVLLRRPWQPTLCLQFSGSERRVRSAACRAADASQRWIFHSATATFRPAIDAGLCLDLFQAGHTEAEAAEGGAQAQAFVGADALRAALSGGGGSDELTLDGGGALGAWPCVGQAPNERFLFDRYMGRYCLSVNPSVCVMEGLLGTPLRLQLPNSLECLHSDGALSALQERPCNASEPRQQWTYDEAALVFRLASDAQRCIDFFASRLTYGVWACRDGQEINSQQQFRLDEPRHRFCLLSDPARCLQEATSSLLY